MKRLLKIFGALTLIGSVAGGVYYLLFVRARKPQVELYFEDGSMVSLPATSQEAAPFVNAADKVLELCPIPR
ncbi:MAG: hypothetical protein N3B14_06840 [Thermoleophilia bacterium]|nr:hypothetical protein [Thermoleophilia bacterium]